MDSSDYIIFRYSHLFDSFVVLARTFFRYSHGFCLFPILARIISFFGTLTYSTLLWYTPELVFDTRTDSVFFRYSLGLYHFSVLTLIRLFRVVARKVFRYLHVFCHISVLARTVFPYSHGFCLFPILARIISFFGTLTYSTLLWYTPEMFFDTRTDSLFFR